MRLSDQVIQRVGLAGRRFLKLKSVFDAFIEELSFFSEPRCPTPGVTIEKSADGYFFTASFTSVVVGFRLLHVQETDQPAAVKVVCTLESPFFTKNKPVIGAFTYNGQGDTDFEVDEGADPINLNGAAPEIVLHFIVEALAWPVPTGVQDA